MTQPAASGGGSRPAFAGRREAAAGFALIGALAAWVLALRLVDPEGLAAMGDLGLAPVLPPVFFASLALLAIGFALAVTAPRPSTGLIVAHLATLVAVWHATPAILYGTPRYPFTYKHVGLGAFIQDHGALDLQYDAYFNWPGFFTLNAFVSDLAGLDGPLALATWGPVFMNGLIVAALALLVHALSDDPRLAWLSVWVFLLGNWVGQDYFAPQALGFALHLVVLGLYVAAFTQPRWQWASAGGSEAVGRSPPDHERGAPPAAGRMAVLAAVVVVYAAIVASHQLTPFVTLASIAALVLLRIGRATLLPVVMSVMLAAWFTYMTEPYLAGHLGELLASVGRVFENLSAASGILALPGEATLSRERTLVLNVRQWLTIAVALVAVLGGIRRVRRGSVDWVAIVLLLMPASMIALQAYGGEMILRVYLFALPLLAWFAAAVVFPAPTSGRGPLAVVAVVALSLPLMAGMSFAYYGNEAMNFVAPAELEVLERVYAVAPDGALVVTPTTNPPTRADRYTDLAYLPLARVAPFEDAPAAAADVEALADALAALGRPATYLVLVRSEMATARLFGELPGVDLVDLAARLAVSPRFDVVHAADGSVAFALVELPGAEP